MEEVAFELVRPGARRRTAHRGLKTARKRNLGAFSRLCAVGCVTLTLVDVSLAPLPSVASQANGTISTIAGNGSEGFFGDGGAATNAGLQHPIGVTIDRVGNILIADYDNRRVRMVTPSGFMSTFAGNGTAGFSGDGGAATSAALGNPWGVAVDGAGNVFISDDGSNRVRMVTPAGMISTVAGNGGAGFSGDGGPATAAQFRPTGVAVDSAGNLFISDYGNSRIRKVTPAGIISTIAGSITPGFSGDGGPATDAALNHPAGLAVDNNGNLFIADYDNSRVRKVTSDGIISTVAGNGSTGFSGDGGPATGAAVGLPLGVAVDRVGNVFVTPAGDHRVRMVTPAGLISTVAGDGTDGFSGDGGPATDAALQVPWGLAADATGNLFIADFIANRIRKVTLAGTGYPAASTVPDFDGDKATDISVFRPFVGEWLIRNQPNVFLGASGDIPVPCDYDGDGATEVAVFRPSVGGWYRHDQSPVFFGLGGDVPVPGDYDGDRHCDIAIFRPSVGGWYIRDQPTAFHGLTSDIPVPGDYDGNGTTDIAVFRPSVGGWYRAGAPTTFFGLPGDVPVPGNYDGDGITGIAIFRPTVGGWYVSGRSPQFLGLASDLPQPGDYNGDGTTDVAVYRPSTGAWFIGGSAPVFFGTSLDLPLVLPSAIRMAVSPDLLLFPWDGSNGHTFAFTGGPHVWSDNVRSGIDFSDGLETRVLAMASGTVISTADEACNGPCKAVKIRLDSGYELWYVHLSSIAPGIEGTRLIQGQWLGNEGESGAPGSVHIHLDLRKQGTPVPWDGVTIEGWTVHDGCSGYRIDLNPQGGAACIEDTIADPDKGDYNGYMSKGNVHVVPMDSGLQFKLSSSNRES